MASGLITSGQIEGENMVVVTDFLFLGSKTTADKIRRWLLLGSKAMTNLDTVLKSRDITLLTKVRIVKAMVFPVVMCSCELDHKEDRVPKNRGLWTVVRRRLLNVPWTERRSRQSNLKGDQPWIFIGRDWCWSWSSSVLVIWGKQSNQWKSPWCWERLKAEGEEGIRGWDGWVASPMQWTQTWANFGRWWGTGRPGMMQSMGSQRVWVTSQQQKHTLKWSAGWGVFHE